MSYESFLLKHRIYCERGNGEHLEEATQVIKINGRDTCVCDFHANGFNYNKKNEESCATIMSAGPPWYAAKCKLNEGHTGEHDFGTRQEARDTFYKTN